MMAFIIVADLILAVLLQIFFYRLLVYVDENSVINNIKNKIQKSERARIEKSELIRRTEGIQERENLFYRMDLLINKSSIKTKIPFFNTEYLILVTILMSVMGAVIGICMGNLIYCPIVAVLLGASPILFLKIISLFTNRKIEEQILHFLNMVENYSRTQDNLITIFGKVYPYLQEPLKSAVRDCYAEAKNTGDLSSAFRKMETKIAYEKFSEVLRNLELCGKYEANYQVIIHESREVMSNYIKSKNKVKAIVDDAKIDFLALFVCIVIIYQVIDSFVGNDLWNILTNGSFGVCIIVYMLIVTIYSVITVYTISKV